MTSPSTIASSTSGGEGDLRQLRLAPAMVDDDELDQAAADVEADGSRFLPKSAIGARLLGGYARSR